MQAIIGSSSNNSSSSPQRNLEPLLRDETGSSYAPPPALSSFSIPAVSSAATTAHTLSQQQQQQQEVSYDLHLTATDINGQVIPPTATTTTDGDDEDLLPPLVSYCAYVRYGCAFGKWILLVLVINGIALTIFYSSSSSWDSNKRLLLAAVWLGTAFWLYGSAKVVDREVQILDGTAQYHQGRRLLEDDDNNGFVLDSENIYGQVSRRVDAFFTPKSMGTGTTGTSTSTRSTTSSLVNVSLAAWAVTFAAAVYLGTGTLLGKYVYKTECNQQQENQNATSYKNDFSNMEPYPQNVQDWIVAQKDPWGSEVQVDLSNDDYIDNNNIDNGDVFYDFPTASSTDIGSFCSMIDGTLFFGGLIPHQSSYPDNGNPPIPWKEMRNHLVLVEIPGNGGGPIKYHTDIINPRMFLPVQYTMIEGAMIGDNDDISDFMATQCCFTASQDASERQKKNQRSWDIIIRTTPLYCIINHQNSTTNPPTWSLEIRKTRIVWKDKSRLGPKVAAASSGNDILIAHVGIDERYRYQETARVRPLDMDSQPPETVYHRTTSQDVMYEEGWGNDYEKGYEIRQCLYGHVHVPSAIASLVVLIMCGVWLIFREGIPAGVAPLTVAVVGLVQSVATGGGSGQQWDSDSRATVVFLWVGTVVLHGVILCGDTGRRRLCGFPAWIGREMYIWVLYSWILSFFLLDLAFGISETFIWSSVLFGLSGILLDHPMALLMGYTSCILGVVTMLLWPFLGTDCLTIGALCLFLGLGIVAAGHCLSNNRRFCVALCRPFSRAGSTLLYGGGSSGGGGGGSEFVAPGHTTVSARSLQQV